MKLTYISEECLTEDAAAKLAEAIKKVLRSSLGDVVRDTDAIYQYATKGLVSHRDELIVQDERWWSDLFILLEPIPEEALQDYYRRTVRWVQDLIERGAKGEQILDEGVLSGLAGLFKMLGKLVLAALQKMFDTQVGGGDVNGVGDAVRQKKRLRYMTQLNSMIIGNYLEGVSGAAKEMVLAQREQEVKRANREQERDTDIWMRQNFANYDS